MHECGYTCVHVCAGAHARVGSCVFKFVFLCGTFVQALSLLICFCAQCSACLRCASTLWCIQTSRFTSGMTGSIWGTLASLWAALQAW